MLIYVKSDAPTREYRAPLGAEDGGLTLSVLVSHKGAVVEASVEAVLARQGQVQLVQARQVHPPELEDLRHQPLKWATVVETPDGERLDSVSGHERMHLATVLRAHVAAWYRARRYTRHRGRSESEPPF